jgi:hydrogenase expression/formation protein HypE
MASREGLEFESTIESDCAPLAEPVLAMLEAGIDVHCLRDLTRGGMATALVEIAEAASLHIDVEEVAVNVREDVAAACEILGFDPLYLANEGRFITILPSYQEQRALEILRKHAISSAALRIGHVDESPASAVTLLNRIGTRRILDMLSGEQLPRIC